VALANKVAARYNLAGIVIQESQPKKINKFSWSQLFEKLLDRTIFIGIRNTWIKLMNSYQQQYPTFPSIESIIVSNINSDSTVNFIRQIEPELVIVSGTSLLKNNILALPIPKGIVNLHTGLSPFIKGGPNCLNWCIAENKFHLIGNTIMWIDAGIDSGDILTTEITRLNGRENLAELHLKVLDHAHELYLKALEKIEQDVTGCPRVKQACVGTGNTYYSYQWNYKAKWRLLKNIKKLRICVLSGKYEKQLMQVKTIGLH
jgi:folate-dependent phosphoribosylglycinamide formyltransferase PurN